MTSNGDIVGRYDNILVALEASREVRNKTMNWLANAGMERLCYSRKVFVQKSGEVIALKNFIIKMGCSPSGFLS